MWEKVGGGGEGKEKVCCWMGKGEDGREKYVARW